MSAATAVPTAAFVARPVTCGGRAGGEGGGCQCILAYMYQCKGRVSAPCPHPPTYTARLTSVENRRICLGCDQGNCSCARNLTKPIL
jgi:hypothetical protein